MGKITQMSMDLEARDARQDALISAITAHLSGNDKSIATLSKDLADCRAIAQEADTVAKRADAASERAVEEASTVSASLDAVQRELSNTVAAAEKRVDAREAALVELTTKKQETMQDEKRGAAVKKLKDELSPQIVANAKVLAELQKAQLRFDGRLYAGAPRTHGQYQEDRRHTYIYIFI